MNDVTDPGKRAWVIRAAGVILYGLVGYGLMFLWDHLGSDQYSWLALIAFPVSIGIAAQILLDPLRLQPRRKVYAWTVGFMAVLAVILILVAVETLICVAIAAPALLVGAFLGIAGARAILRLLSGRFDGARLHASLLILPVLLGMPNDPRLSSEAVYEVTTDIIITATPAEIWAHLLDIPQIQPEERIFTISHDLLGAPRAMKAVMGPDVRMAHWEMDIRFAERLTTTIEEQLLTWEFEFDEDFQMPGIDAHIRPRGDVLNVYGGRYVITPLNKGRARLTLATGYSLTTPMNWYVSLWGHQFLNDFHSSVLHVIKLRAEAT